LSSSLAAAEHSEDGNFVKAEAQPQGEMSQFQDPFIRKFCNRALAMRFMVWHRTFPFRFAVNVVKARHE